MSKYTKYFGMLDIIERSFYSKVDKLEKYMKKQTGEDLEFFWCDNSIVGIGNVDRTMKLIHREEVN